MIKVIIVDDEKHCVESLSIQLEKFTDKLQVIKTFTSPKMALDFLKTNSPDLVFLDVEMPEMNGFDLLNEIPDADFDVVFTTAYDEFAVKAFRISAFDYLLKPVIEEELEKCILQYESQKHKAKLNDHLDKLMDILSSPKMIPNKIALPTSNGLEFVEYAQIIRVESDSNYSILHLKEKKEMVVCRTLKEMEEILQDFNFIRVHHSHIINPDFLQRFVKQDGGYVILTDGSVISVSRSRKESFLNKFPGA